MPDISIGRFRGGFCVYWTKSDGKRARYKLAACTRAAAEPEAIDVYRRENQKAPGANTIATLWEAYRDDLGSKPTAKTMGYTGKAVLEHFGAYRPDQIDKALCRAYSDKRLAAGKSVGTVWTELGHLQSTMNFARDINAIDRAPRIWRPVKPETDKRILNAGEARALIDGAHDPHIRLALILLLGTAARVGAVLELTWDRVDFERNSINLRIDDGTTRKGRAIVPMNSGVRAALSVANEAALSDYVIEYAGQPIKSIRTGFKAATVRARLGRVTIHELRHTAAVTMLSAGVPLVKVGQMLGHTNTAVTYRTYARYLPEQMQDAADVLDFANLKRSV
nr:site-specific integrase [Thalassovita sp.]